ncbi:MAG: hypothetical protein M3459_07800 [Actinomycetota bacterium]|nr:hypothetical protein [Actinomycetota bacterium]
MADTRVTIRLSAAQLDAVAGAAGVSRSVALRRRVDGSTAAAPSGQRLDHEGLVDLLHEQARSGSAPAVRELLARMETDEAIEQARALTADD